MATNPPAEVKPWSIADVLPFVRRARGVAVVFRVVLSGVIDTLKNLDRELSAFGTDTETT